MWGVRRGGRDLGRWVRDGSPAGGFSAFDPAGMPAMDSWALHVGPCERQVEIYDGFSPCRTAKRWISQPIARGGVASPAGLGSSAACKASQSTAKAPTPACLGVGTCRFIAHVRVRDESRHQGDEGPSTDVLRAFSTRPSRCGCAGCTCAQGRCPSRAGGRPGRR